MSRRFLSSQWDESTQTKLTTLSSCKSRALTTVSAKSASTTLKNCLKSAFKTLRAKKWLARVIKSALVVPDPQTFQSWLSQSESTRRCNLWKVPSNQSTRMADLSIGKSAELASRKHASASIATIRALRRLATIKRAASASTLLRCKKRSREKRRQSISASLRLKEVKSSHRSSA